MGQTNSAVIMIGLSFLDVCDDEGDFYNEYEPLGLKLSHPTYDCCVEDCVVGVPVLKTDSAVELDTLEMFGGILAAQDKFREITGKDGLTLLALDID